MNITDEQIDAALRAYCAADSMRQGMRAALSAALAVQPAEPVAWLNPDSGEVQNALTVADWRHHGGFGRRHAAAKFTVPLYPPPQQPARVPQPVALPALPEPRWTGAGERPYGSAYSPAQMTAYARAALAAAGVTVAEGGDRG